MNDKELADKVIALGVGDTTRVGTVTYYHLPPDSGTQAEPAYGPEAFVRDWRIAGAVIDFLLLQEAEVVEIDIWQSRSKAMSRVALGGVCSPPFLCRDESTPRSVIEACVEALS